MERDARSAGRALDAIDGPGAELESAALASRGLGDGLQGVRREARGAVPELARFETRVRGAAREMRRARVDADRLTVSLERLGRVTARPSVDVRGIAAGRAQVAALRADLRRLGAEQAAATVGVTRVGAGGGDRGGIGLGRLALLAGVTALPFGQALGGAGVATLGSAGGAALGAGGVGLSGGGVLAAGLAAVAPVAKQVKSGLEDLTKAQEAYTQAVQAYGAASVQAADADRVRQRVLRQNPGAGYAASETRMLTGAFRRQTQQGRQDLFGLLGDAAQIGRRATPRLARNANTSSAAVRRAGVSQARFLAGDFSLDTLSILSREFAHDLPLAERSLQDIEVVLARTARAGLPFFREGVEWVNDTTAGWRANTKSITETRRQIGGYVDDLRAWGHLTHSAFELAKDVLDGGRPSGRSAVEDLTKTLDRWDRWVDRNPEKIDAFFRGAVTDTKEIAGSVGDITRGLNDMASELRPIIAPLTRIASLFGDITAATSPGVAMAAFMGLGAVRRGARNGFGGAGGAPAAGMPAGGMPGAVGPGAVGGMLPFLFGSRAAGPAGLTQWQRAMRAYGGAAYGARQGGAGALSSARAGLGGASTAIGRSGGYGRLAGAAAGRTAGVAGRFALPALAIGGLQGAFGPAGANQGEGIIGKSAAAVVNTAQGAVNIFGIGNPVLGTDERTNRGLSRAQQLVSQLPGGQTPTAREARAAQRQLAPDLAAAEQAYADASKPNDLAESLAYLQTLRAQARAYKDIAKEAKRAREIERRRVSRERGAGIFNDLVGAYDVRAPKLGPEAAMERLTSGMLDRLRTLAPQGRRILAESTLQWARDQARANPALLDEYEALAKGVERRYSRIGRRVQVVNGEIRTGTAKDWSRIRELMTSQTERARQEVSADLTAIQRQAVGGLVAMGYSEREAQSIVRNAERGGRPGRVSRHILQNPRSSGAPFSPKSIRSATRTGDAWGIDAHRTGRNPSGTPTRSAAGGGNLMGADPALGGYAALASQFGNHVTSGLRPGAITSSGNRSYHASGDAIDVAGGDMAGFARAMASRYGSQLEELIFSPLGWGIKNGKRVPLSTFGAQVIADHYDHVHVADTQPSAVPGGGFGATPAMGGALTGKISLKGPGSDLPGAPGALVGAAGSVYAAGLEKAINDHLGAGGTIGGDVPVPAGGKLSQSQIAALAAQVGFPDPKLVSAIAMAESSGIVGNINSIGATGLMQILQSAHPQYDPRRLASDPLYNLRAAYAISSGGRNWRPWEVYTNGMYRKFMGDGIGRSRVTGAVGGPRRGVAGGRRSGGAGASVNFAPSITVHRRSDLAGVRSEISAYVDQVIDALAAELETGDEDEMAVMS